MQQQPSESITPQERLERLSQIVSTRTLQGWTVVDRNEREAYAVLDLAAKPVNHVLHAIITIFTCGVWAIVWIVLALTYRKQKRVRISIDAYGNLLEEGITL